MSEVLLVQPDAGGRVSGGYLYNARMAAHGAWRLLDVTADALPDALAALAALSPEERPAVVLADSIWLTESALPPFLALRKSGIATGVMMHSFPSMIAAAEEGGEVRREPTGFEYEAVEMLGTMVVPGRHYAEMMAGRVVRVIEAPPGIDERWRMAPRARQGECRLVSVGAVTPRKGFLDLADILLARLTELPTGRMPAPTDSQTDASCDLVSWTIVGSLDVDPVYTARVRNRVDAINRLANHEAVIFAGQCTPAETCAHVQQADILVMPSYDENQPLVLLEAIAASVPSVAYAAGAAERMLGYGKAGLVSPIGDREQLSANLNLLIDLEPKRFAMSEACWQMQESLPTWQESAAATRAAVMANR